MAYAITQTCCNDATCVSVCPVNCIHPSPDDPDFGQTDMLFVDPQTCIDCGACADACPVDAIFPVDTLFGQDAVYADINAQYYGGKPADNSWGAPRFPRTLPRSLPSGFGPLRIAVVGTGPASCYAAQSLLRGTSAEVTMIDRLPVPGGLVRYGVAPDHPSTKKIDFASLYQHPRLRMYLNVEVGKDITHAELTAHHHAVIYGVGAAHDRTLGIPGEELAGSVSATEFVGWYNAHPAVPADAIDLSARRAVIIGTGNVAVDVARILLSDPETLARTDIADHALAALRESKVREVVLLGRRGPEHAAFTRSEFLALQRLPGVRLVMDGSEKTPLLADVDSEAIDWTAPPPAERRIVLRFHCTPTELRGDDRVRSVRTSTGDIPAGLVLRSIGYRSAPVPDLPFDEATATVPNESGRVSVGTYVVGWIKRGPSGGIGTNRTCSEDTVEALLDDAEKLTAPTGSGKDFTRLVRRRKPDSLGRKEMLAIDKAERRRGVVEGRPRVKFASVAELLAAGKG